jgi:hypothetical protein
MKVLGVGGLEDEFSIIGFKHSRMKALGVGGLDEFSIIGFGDENPHIL